MKFRFYWRTTIRLFCCIKFRLFCWIFNNDQ